jgi:glucosamine-6-phosphate deaminase
MNNDLTAFEKIPVKIFNTSEEGSGFVAREIVSLVRSRQKENKPCVLGLATGSSPTRLYAELVRIHKTDGLSFKNVHTFNLDEYFPMQPEALQSYVRFMREHLFDHIDIPKKNIHIPDGTVDKQEIGEFCRSYEEKIDRLGGMDIQILGIGRTERLRPRA